MRVAVLQHLPEEGPGHIAAWAARRQHGLTVFRADLGQLPDTGDAGDATGFDAMIVLGGPYCVFADAEPAWMTAEKALLQDILAPKGKPLLGICMGAQLIAQLLGAELHKMETPELGWQDLQPLTSPFAPGNPIPVLQWHEDAFSLPAGARHLASSAHWPIQAYQWGPQVMGLQFHAEWDAGIVAALRLRFGADAPFAAPSAADTPRYAAAHDLLELLLDAWMQTAYAANPG